MFFFFWCGLKSMHAEEQSDANKLFFLKKKTDFSIGLQIYLDSRFTILLPPIFSTTKHKLFFFQIF